MKSSMLLTKIILQDFGVYRGKNEFDLTCDVEKPVVLIGGTNGAGKTTLFESVMLCLYGMSHATKKRYTKKTYEQFISKKIHKYNVEKFTKQVDSASITVQFKFFHAGRETEYRVNRMWKKTSSGLEEVLQIYKRNVGDSQQFAPLDVVEESYWQSFIKDLIPKGVVDLFFFDGERVVEMAREEKEDFAIKESFHSLLGLDIIEQLRADLQVNLMRNLTSNSSVLQDDYEKCKTEKTEYRNSNMHLEERLAQKQNELDHLQIKINSIESKLSKIGGEFVSKRDVAKENLAVKKSEYSFVEKRIQDNCSNCLPFSLMHDKLDDIVHDIENDQQILQKNLSVKSVATNIDMIKSDITSDKFWDETTLDKNDILDVQKKIFKLLDAKTIISDTKQKHEIFGFSSTQTAKILKTIDEANNSALDMLSSDTQKILILGEEIQKLERTIASTAGDDEVGIMISELSEINSQSGELKAEMKYIEEKISNNNAMCTHIDSKMRNLVAQMYQNEKSTTKVELTQRVQHVLDEFLEEIKLVKIQLLEQYLLEDIQLLMRKKHFIEKIQINPDTFGIVLFDANNQQISKETLSEGEKQMFATAVLWALAKTSGKSLPFMIDTPLARLDEGHRTNLVENFLPLASHQIVLFSTDKEIEFEYYKILKPYVARSYVMEFSEQTGSTTCHDGYFWNLKGERVIAV